MGVPGNRGTEKRRMSRAFRVLAIIATSVACESNAPDGDPRELDGSWAGTTSTGAYVRLHMAYREYRGAGAYGEDVRVLEYSGYFVDAAGAADTVREQGYRLSAIPRYAYHPVTLDLWSSSTETARYEYYVRGERTKAGVFNGWLIRSGGPYNTYAVEDSTTLVLTRF